MDETASMSADEAQNMLSKTDPLSPEEVVKVLRFLKHANEDLIGKIRQLKSEVGRLSRR